jgi:hypothetical protein
MKAILKQVWAVYNTDGSGYNSGPPMALYPIKAAAEASEEFVNQRGYGSVSPVKACQFEDVIYIYESEVPNQKVKGGCGIGAFVNAFKIEYTIRGEREDKVEYIIGDENLLKALNSKYYSVRIYPVYLTRDEDKYFILSWPNTFAIKSFTMSRELAVKHALSKLTSEEKKLLGV